MNFSPFEWLVLRVDPHVIPEGVLLPQHLATDVASELVLQEHLVVDGQVAVLGGLPSMIGAKVALPLLLGVVLDLELCNGRKQSSKSQIRTD